MEIHTCLRNEVDAFDFSEEDFEPLRMAFERARVHCHDTTAELIQHGGEAEYILTWDFEAGWYESFPSLDAVMTPAAGDDWVEPDPCGRARLIHGTFHGTILSESLLSAILFMNHRMPDMIRNHAAREWDRNIQASSRLLKNQTILIIGLGHIGQACAIRLRQMARRVIGIRRRASRSGNVDGIETFGVDRLDELLADADHIVLLLPGNASTNRLLDERRLRRCKPGAYVYNFGRGNSLASRDLVAVQDHIGGAFLDVVDEEPLPHDSPLWTLPNVFTTPHSSCVYEDYRTEFVSEVIMRLRQRS
jgi:phosphoglycerate dehydrogenase-like enzyme